MAVNSIKIFDDTVLKLSVNQGLEDQRATETLGSFTMGELAYTRDTGRLFVGDNSDEAHFGLHQTVGGILVGNKYLGLIDSKPLVIFGNNGKPLNYETPTSPAGTQELASMTEQALLLKDSKYRLKSPEGATEEWQHWDRTATYNPKYNAYNGDYMFDIYNNAFILFDNRISGDINSKFQPQIKKDGPDEHKLPVSPETFIVDGEEIPSTDQRAVSLTRRTILQNYNKVNSDNTAATSVYGDGYVVMRIIEPDNESIRFRPRSFSSNGTPENGDGNYSHNIIEILKVAPKHLTDALGDDFVIDDVVYLNKDIANVNSITGNGGNLKIARNIIFATPNANARGSVGFMQWNFEAPGEIAEGSTDAYKLELIPDAMVADRDNSSVKYRRFIARISKDSPPIPTYRIALSGGLASSQSNPRVLSIDSSCTGDSYPTLSIDPTAEGEIFDGEETSPFATVDSDGLIYTNNLMVAKGGRIMNTDVYSDALYANAADKIDRYEEQNTSINYLKEPVTIISSSYDTSIFSDITGSINARLDFILNPYLYCRRKIVSSPNTTMLPSATGANTPDPTDSYFTSFSDTNVKVWNNLLMVMGQNHYGNLNSSNLNSEIPILNDSIDSSIKKPVFKTMDTYQVNDAETGKLAHNTFNDLEMLDDAVFAWYKQEITDPETNTKTTAYLLLDEFDSRPASEKETGTMQFEYLYLEDDTTNNLITGGNGIKTYESEEEGEKRTYYAIFDDSTLLNRLQSYFRYGNNSFGWRAKYSLTKQTGLSFDYAINFKQSDVDGINKIVFVNAANNKTTISNAKGWITDNRITVDMLLPNSNMTAMNFNSMLIYFDPPPEDQDDDWDDGEDNTNEEDSVAVFDIVKSVPYFIGAAPPSTLSNVKVYDGSSVVTGTVDETIDVANRVYIPNHARNIILEVTHITESNNRIGIFYANEFEDLKVNASGTSINQGFLPPFSQADYSGSGTYKLSVPTVRHDDSYIYSPNSKEKSLCVTSASETKIIEVPLQKSSFSDQRHFALRLANIIPSTTSAINYLAIRVLGYRV